MASTYNNVNKDALILPPELVSRQACSECHKYLSVGPVVVTRGGKTICGRCNMNSSLYDQVVENCLFPCVNYNAGCQELLPYNEAKEHEANCSKKAIVSCPFCSYKGDERELVRHFKENHSEYVVDNIFKLIPEDGGTKNLIFLKDEHILCITVVTRGRFFKIYNTLLTPSFSKFARFMLSFFKLNADNHVITFRIRITHNSNDFPVDTDANYEEEVDDYYVQLDNCFLIAHEYIVNYLRSDTYYCEMNYVDDQNRGLEVAKRELKNVKKDEKPLVSKLVPSQICLEKISLKYLYRALKMYTAIDLRQLAKKNLVEFPKCSRCKKCITNTISCFICPTEHFVCSNCMGMKCPECESFVQWKLYKYHTILLTCEWNCQKEINFFDYREHVRFCKARLYKCPGRDCQYIGVLDDFKKHWHLNQRLYDCRDMWVYWHEQSFYWLLPFQRELVYVTFEIVSDGGGLVTVYEDYALFPELYTINIISHCNVVQGWVPLKSGIGRCKKIKASECFLLVESQSRSQSKYYHNIYPQY